MLHFKIEDEVNPKDYDDPMERELAHFFLLFKDIIDTGKHLSLFEELRKKEEQLKRNCRIRNYGFFLGERPLIWSKDTGEYLMDIKIPEQDVDELSLELTAWRNS